ncbi:MAG: Gfo/Idh/MocA family oxidoreductase [Rhizobiaceae bacterium]
MSSIRIAVIGAGKMAEEHSRALASIPGIELSGIHSRTRAKAVALANTYNIADVYDSIAEMQSRALADAVIIAVNEMSLLAIIEEVVKTDWAIFMEKPPGRNLTVALEIERALSKAGRSSYVGLNRRFYDSTVEAQRILTETEGRRHVTIFDQQSMAGARAIGHPEQVVQHFMYANSIHLIDYARLFCRGEASRVMPDRPWEGENTFFHGATVEFASGDTARYEAVWKGPGPWAVAVATETSRLELRPLEALSVQRIGSRTQEAVVAADAASEFKPGFLRQAHEFVKAIRGEPSDLPEMADAIETMRLIHAIYSV